MARRIFAARSAAAANEVEGRGRGVAGCFKGDGVEQHAVDGEVAAEDVFAGVGGEADGVGAAAVAVGSVVAEGGDLGGDACIADEDDAEVRADGEGLWEELLHDVRGGAGGYVEVLGLVAEQEIADASAGEVGLMARGAQGKDDVAGCEVLRVGVERCGHDCPL